MKITRILALVFALIMTLSLVSCGGESESETTAEVIDLDLHSVRDGASEWAGIRPEVSSNAEIEGLKILKNLIKDKYGITIQLDTDGKRMPGTDPEYQILIGRTDEPESAGAIEFINSLPRGQVAYLIEALEKRLVIVASNTSMYEAAIAYLAENFMTEIFTKMMLLKY